MPLLLDDIDLTTAQATTKTVDPKFFSSKLTGNGKHKTGLLHSELRPADKAVNTAYSALAIDHITKKASTTQHGITVVSLPFAPLLRSALTEAGGSFTIATPQAGDRCIIETGSNDWDVFFDMTPQGARLFEDANGKSSTGGTAISRDFIVQYRMELFFVKKGTAEPVRVPIVSATTGPRNHDAAVFLNWDTDPMGHAYAYIVEVLRGAGLTHQNPDALADWLTNGFNVHDRIAWQAEIWDSEGIADEVNAYIDGLPSNPADQLLNALALQLRYLETYNVPLEAYRSIHKKIEAVFSEGIAAALSKQNLNLLMSHTLSHLEGMKPQLNTPPQPLTPPALRPELSHQQLSGVTTHEPLVMMQAGAGTGKAQPLDEPVLTPHGWVPMGDLKVGDFVVGSNGKPTKVTHVHERGLLNGYELTFRDGSSTRVCNEHLWTLHNQSRTGVQTRVKSTQEWIDSPSKDKYYLPVVEPVEFNEQDLPLDPYFLGALIADGSLHERAGYTKSEQPVIEAVYEAASRDGFVMYETTCATSTARQWKFKHSEDDVHRSELKERLRSLRLNVKSNEKFIPNEYLVSNVEQRQWLLRGLFDGDGRTRTGRGYAQYSTVSEQLADDVLQLLWSLGLSATKQLNKHSRGDYWIINLHDADPFFAARHAGNVSGTVRPTRRALKKAERMDSVPMRCITVEAEDSLYVTKDYLVTHNSSVILERIKYLEACGVPASDVTVLSFTNAAADNITAKNPNVGSMTIARMINDIYKLNHPTHELSSIDTIINSIDIFYPTDNFAAGLRMRLMEVAQNKTGAFTSLNTYIENHFDEMMSLLDTIKQTSLELEIIIAYQRIDSMQEPAHVQSKYLIIDEVQDNSIFEFIYVLKYITKHAQSLFIVGDASQTLYEFRSANPRALNTLEGSGVFSTFKLTTNYRSNQEILDFANVVLGDLETNQIAGIQLQANSLAVPTAKSFQEKVTLDYRAAPKLRGFISEELSSIVMNTIFRYVDDCLARGEQVCFLAYSRIEVAIIQQALQQKYPQRHVASLVSEKVFSTDIFSKYIKNFWNDVLQVQPANAAFVVVQGIKDNLDKLTRNAGNKKVEQAVLRMVSKWWTENAPAIRGWEQLCMQGSLSYKEFFERLRDNLLSFEIRHNAVRQSLTNQANRERKEKNAESGADLLVSTIHGAKGMEFDNVVILHKEDTKMSQASRREFYVAFTRAKKTEYILSYGTVKNPPIESSYEQIVNLLTKRDIQNAARAAGVDPDLLDEETEDTLKKDAAALVTA
ncbi:3'-5' exonuclease [Arthrobacter sp. efr-133-TYG-118]|uniref:3'-5' exonuclease n=1 Tax=Arthrobacter sp. efr-133-TYG-118 TaxID=3040279 RepID=UPI0025511544|nr:3'-5' exonuclease [Arthrobacter sp. efr-133-TYG-118]